MGASDRLSIVEFASNVKVVLEPAFMVGHNKTKARALVSQMRATTCTNLSGGTQKALELLRDANVIDGAIRRCMVFTDGYANQGVTDPDELTTMVEEYRQGIPISAFGYGTQYNAALLDTMSKSGTVHHVNSPDRIMRAFGIELGGLLATFAQNVELTLTPTSDIEIVEVLNDLDVDEKDNGSIVITCDDLLADQEYGVVINAKIPNRDKHGPRKIPVIRGVIKYFDIGEKETKRVNCALKVKFVVPGKEDTAENSRVMEEVALQRIVQAQAKATKLADAGDFRGAQAMFVGAASAASAVGSERSIQYASAAMAMSNAHTPDNYAAMGNAARSASRQLATGRGSVGELGGVDMDMLNLSASQLSTGESFMVDNTDGGTGDADAVNVQHNDGSASQVGAWPVNESIANIAFTIGDGNPVVINAGNQPQSADPPDDNQEDDNQEDDNQEDDKKRSSLSKSRSGSKW